MSKNKITLGLDLGTDNCCITYQDNIGRPFIITDNKDHKISSIIGIMNQGILVGNEICKDFIYDIPIITNLKRLIGHKSADIEAQQIAKYNNWSLSDSLDGDLIIIISNNEYKLNDLMCILLNKIKQIIISNVGNDFDLIITIPANFNEGQKNSILSYCKQLNIECKRLIYEPCAAALTYINYFESNYNINSDNTDSDSSDTVNFKNILVFDFGAGTLDLAIVTCSSSIDNNEIEWLANIQSHIGDNNLGGIDIDMALAEFIETKYPNFKEITKSNKFIIENIKIKLSNLYKSHQNNKVSLSDKYYDHNIIINLEEYFNILDHKFKSRIIDLLNLIHQSDKKILKEDIDIILLIGGSCYNPWIKNLISNYYEKDISDYKLKLSDHLETYNLDLKDIGVSLGASCVNRKFNKNGNTLILTESLPLSIGIDTVNNLMCKILPKGSLIPCSAKKYFTTSEDNQTKIEIKLYQGERDDIRDNFFLGSFIMDNLDPEPQGKIVIIVNLSITTDGLITLEGQVKNSDKFNKKIIINRYNINLNDQLIESNIKEYETNDYVFNSIMLKYYDLVTKLNKLQYNLLDNITCNYDNDFIDSIFNLFWNDLTTIYNLMLQSDKIKLNIEQLTKFINYIKNKLNYQDNNTIIDYIDDKSIIIKLDKLNKFIEKNLQHFVTTYQIKTDSINESNYDTIESDIKLDEVNSINNSTEILNDIEKKMLSKLESELENSDIESIKSNFYYVDQIKKLIIMILTNFNEIKMPDLNKILLLEIIEKYYDYINKIIINDSFNGEYYLDILQNINCILLEDINKEFINNLKDKIEKINKESDDFIENFEQILNDIINLKKIITNTILYA